MSANMEIKEVNGNKSVGALQPSSPPTAAMHAATSNSQYPYCYLNQPMPQNSNYYANNNSNNYQNFNNNMYWNNNYQQQQHYNYQQNFNYYHQYHQNVNNNNNAQMMQQQYYQNQFKPHRNNDNNNRNYQKNNYNPNNPNNFQHKNKNNHGNFQKNNAHNQHNNNSNNNSNNNNNNNNNNRGKNKKIKIDKRDLPENNAFYCEVCDRGFKTDDKYKEHYSTHTTCNVNGCKFTAAARLVEIHFENFHATGLDKKVPSLQTEEEIAKYRNERKKNFPSLGNLEKRSKLEDEKEARGVRLNTQQYGKLKANKCPNNSNLAKSVDQVSQISESSVAAKEIPKPLSRNMKRKISKRNKNKKKSSSLFERKAEVLRNKYKKPTLLQKLLAEEIRHERNILLQCIKYIVANNFFDKKKLDTGATNPVILNNDNKMQTSIMQNSDLSEEIKL